ncbi:MAG: hypothetical protein KBT33_06005 [Prevotellaceae bacterium]|nr:hypothetical protein [Candidatus Minthosoma equi]
MESNDNELLTFRKFRFDEESSETDLCREAAIDKLQTLFPGKRITIYDSFTFGIETDSLYSESGIDTYELGIIDDELYAIRNARDLNVFTFRI